MIAQPRHLLIAALCFGLAGTAVTESADAATKRKSARKRAITKLTFDPKAEKVDFYDAMDAGTLDIKVIAKDETEGSLLIENKTGKPLSVAMPDAIVGVQVLQQFGAGAGAGAGLGQQGGAQGGGNAQSFGGGGGGFGQGGGGLGGGGFGQGGGGAGFFSIPPEKVVKVNYNSVCLNHGKPEPHPRMTYRLVRPEQYTKDETLVEMLRMVATGRLNQKAAQAATWHLTDKMTWKELAAKSVRHLGGQPPTPYFTRAELALAFRMVKQAEAQAKERKKAAPKDGKIEKPAIPSRVSPRTR